ncbi:transglutaminase domain-containing protein [Rhodococcus sp. SGAir0479]|uniref:transglutaminase domain-containing protein n=1 Tax=Rhodococcus sp. SGAir0479 TaxID=2567884 RepID=UPI0020C766ED|nr:transglutaminase domain-containing protein [Rhodococcus sp. SGAir0479]
MTCSLVTGWGRASRGFGCCGDSEGGVEETRILDWCAPAFDRFPMRGTGGSRSEADYLRRAHGWVQGAVRPVYALDDLQPASVTVAKSRGSCSQRLAVVEALARRAGIATRVEGLVLRGEFWYPRFRYLRPFVPDRVLLAWPSFLVDRGWLDASAVFSEGCRLQSTAFSNRGSETLFDAAARARIRWGETPVSSGCVDLSGYVVESLGTFDSRDDLFGAYGQTLIRPVRTVLEPVFSRWAAS